MNRHTVFVAGKRFVLLSEEKSEYVQKLAQEVNDAIVNISTENPSLESRACAILCALDYADDMYKEQEKNSRFSQKAQEVIVQSEAHAKKVKELLVEIEEKNKEIEDLKKKLEQLTHQNSQQTQNKPVVKKAEVKANTQPKNQTPKPKKENPMENLPKPENIINKGYTPKRQISLFDNE